MVGPWLPTNSSTISEGLIHTPETKWRSRCKDWNLSTVKAWELLVKHSQIHLMRWLPLCPPPHSSRPQRFPQSLCNCGLKLPSANTHVFLVCFIWKTAKSESEWCKLFPYLCVPDVHAFVKRAASQMPTIRAESHTVDRFLMFGESVNTDASIHVPETDCGVKRCTVDGRRRCETGHNSLIWRVADYCRMQFVGHVKT